ncbi:ERCC4 domain-containing protein [Eubacteriaceae bacterium Marseille-Q4139]|nr:ERCC4 domain-containing protein [Eubacteriaceae bacterium Marseille-Q4139]
MKRYRFSVEDIKKLLKSMVVLVDSREKKNGHILEYFAKQGIAYQETKLDYGDYSFYIPAEAAGEDIYFHRDIVIERKGSLEELSGNLAQERERFEKEFLKAGNDGCKVYLLIEAPGGYSDIIGHRYHTEMKPAAFAASLKTWEHRFGANVQFIDRQYSGYLIASTFQYYARETLK